MRILICDDREEGLRESRVAAEEGLKAAGMNPEEHELETRSGKQLSEDLEHLFLYVSERVRAAEANGPAPDRPASTFDGRDLILIDNNLSHLDMRGARHTAETVAGYIRGFTEASYVVSLNRNPTVDMDLRFLMGDYSTKADLALNTDHLRNPALWTADPSSASDSFRPWYWPELREAGAKRQAQIESLRTALDQPILSFFGFPELAVATLSRHALGVLSPEVPKGEGDQHIQAITFREFFVSSVKALPAPQEREALSSADDVVLRTVAAEIDAWFRRDVLGPQDILVDVPHLLIRFPLLLGQRVGELDAWNAAALAREAPFGLDEELAQKFVLPHAFARREWIDRPAFWWPALNRNRDLNTLFFSDQSEWPNFVFCEDTSRFVRPEDGPVEFQAELDSPWSRRFVERVGSHRYAPLSRLAA